MKGCASHALASQTCCPGHLSHPRQLKLTWWPGHKAGNAVGGSGKLLCHFRRPVACNMIIHPSIYPSTCIGQAAPHMQGLKAAVTIVHAFTAPRMVMYVATTRDTERKSKIVSKRVGPPPYAKHPSLHHHWVTQQVYLVKQQNARLMICLDEGSYSKHGLCMYARTCAGCPPLSITLAMKGDMSLAQKKRQGKRCGCRTLGQKVTAMKELVLAA